MKIALIHIAMWCLLFALYRGPLDSGLSVWVDAVLAMAPMISSVITLAICNVKKSYEKYEQQKQN